MSTATDDFVEQAFAGNGLLSAFDMEARSLIAPHARIVELDFGEIVLRQGEDVTTSLFPYGPTMISMVVELSPGRSVEVALIGRRGAVGGIVSCGHAPAFTRARVLVGGPALGVPMQALEDAKLRAPFIANLFCRFSDYLLAQAMQSVACNAFHPIEQRAARWLLHAQDRTGDRIELTQQAFAGLLGVQRTTLNAVIQVLENEGLIQTRRGVLRIADRAGLKRRTCECYEALERHYRAVIGADGRGS